MYRISFTLNLGDVHYIVDADQVSATLDDLTKIGVSNIRVSMEDSPEKPSNS